MEQVLRIVCDVGDLGELKADEDFYDAGFSSLGSLQLLLELESTFGLAIPDEEFINARSAQALHDLVIRLQRGAHPCA